MTQNEKYKRIKELMKRDYLMEFGSIEEFYAFVVWILYDKYKVKQKASIIIAKTIDVLYHLCNVKTGEHPNIPTIHKFGPECVGNYEICKGRKYEDIENSKLNMFKILGNVANIDNGGIIDFESISDEGRDRLRETVSRYKKYESHVSDIVSKIIDFGDNEDRINLAYNLCLGRDEYDPSRRILGMEAFSEIVINSICRNFSRARAKGVIPKKSDLDSYKALAIIERIKNSGDTPIEIKDIYNSAEVKEDLKYGSKNNIVKYLAIYFLNLMGFKTGTSKNKIENLCCLLSPYYIDYKDKCSSLEEGKNKSEIMTKIQEIERVVKLGVENLEKQGVIKEDDKNIHNYLVLGPKIRVNINGNTKDKILPHQSELTNLRREIRSISKYLKDEKFIM